MGRLYKLELENFKSYKGHQVIGPFFNFSCIIGPNGAGKSNLMDAISFVLGVKSSQLRSSHLKDLIYRGGTINNSINSPGDNVTETDSTGPKKAWVMAEYHTTDERVLKFMRVITINGASEYRFNGKVTTYEKYNKELEKENILVKAKNFLVFQGDVEAIASQSPRDLTRLIEQVSGSLELKEEYERLKEEQEKATEDSTYNFNKKRGINAEMKQFKKQKEEAENYKQLTKQLENLKIKYMLWKLYQMDKQIKELKDDIDSKNDQISEKAEEKKQEEGILRGMKKDLSIISNSIIHSEKKRKNKEKEINSRKLEKVSTKEQITNCNEKIGQVKKNIEKIQQDYLKQNDAIIELEDQLNKVNNAAKIFEQNIKNKEKSEIIKLDSNALQQYNKLKEYARIKTLQLSQEIETIQRKKRVDNESHQRLKGKIDEFRIRQNELNVELRNLKTQKNNSTDELENFTRKLNENKKDLEEVITQQQKTALLEKELNDKLNDIHERLMQAKADKLETHRDYVIKETIKRLKKIYPGVHGRVLDLCKPIQRKYDIAVSIILGRNLDAIVVDDNKTAIECIQYLKEKRIGTSTFIPINSISVKPINEKYRSYVKGAHLAIDVIQYDSIYEKVIQFICGNSMVCDDLSIAKEICYNRKQEIKVVTLNGVVIHKTGMITGGQSGISRQAKRWEEKQIEELKVMKEDLDKKLNEIARSKYKTSRIEYLNSEISSYQTKITFIKQDLNTLEKRIESSQKEADYTLKEIAKLEPLSSKLKIDINNANYKIDVTTNKINAITDEIFHDFCRKIKVKNIREYEENQQRITTEINEKRLEFTTQQSKLSSQLVFQKDQMKELENRKEKLNDSISDEEELLANLKIDLGDLEHNIEILEANSKSIMDVLNEQKDTLRKIKDSIMNKEKDINKITTYINSLEKAITDLDTSLEKLYGERYIILKKCKMNDINIPLLKGKLSELMDNEIETSYDPNSMDIDQIANSQVSHDNNKRLLIDYSMLDDKLKEDKEMNQKFLDEMKKVTAECEAIIPNMKAYEKLDETEQKLKETNKIFEISRQKAKTAKERFNKIKEKRYNLFYSAFKHMESKIQPIYEELTRTRTSANGPVLHGTAYLSLEDSEEPYLDGVKYHAMPPAKTFRDMDHLSGGEKTVAALALLFAIHSYQPSPFFVLDEVDAALDNANVMRVASYVKRHASDNFQFVVISLKNTFYEKAQALVGIYRDREVNSSKVLTLKLDGEYEN
ncbi:cohesin complex subunit psm1 [Neocallimastix californiae]|jgi:structural maintenance of chromosome 1|uniref:Structural maintenance of chromosomes protein n=1 Tax=Neocallimastix californiae TaxID=1754190 RepID=A0A1Y2FHF4_9FUNG|nr:cohesin complex subunit psm1 [Neocallimastix californiae]|eukprot:ORY83359.1 cohesin complex subunit psm1 [Neocallimastix californiae]